MSVFQFEITGFIISYCLESILSSCHLRDKPTSSIKTAKYRLSCLALEEIFGRENDDALFGGSDNDDNGNGLETKDNSSVREKVRTFFQLVLQRDNPTFANLHCQYKM